VFREAFNSAIDNHPGDESRAFRSAHTAAKNCEASVTKAAIPLKAVVVDDEHFRLLAFPFGGPIPAPAAPRGVDLDGEWFSERTDIKPDWLPYRMVDWHHGADATLGRTIIGKADNLTMEEDGWWVDVWLRHGEKRLELVRKLAERGAQLFGSSESVAGMVKKSSTGEILKWPYWRQTLTTSPQNTLSVVRPFKAVLEEAVAEYQPNPSFWRDVIEQLDNLTPDLQLTSPGGEDEAKAGRVLSAANEAALRDALDSLGLSVQRLNEVLAKLQKG
jgi:hypothetical protein